MRRQRIIRPQHAATALSGAGARLCGGHWNSPGHPCVYAAESRALAVLAMLVHLTGRSRGFSWRLLTLEITDDLVSDAGPAPAGWDATPPGPTSQAFGDAWLEAQMSAALRVPSALVPGESNLLINPRAHGFAQIRIVEEQPTDARCYPDPPEATSFSRRPSWVRA